MHSVKVNIALIAKEKNVSRRAQRVQEGLSPLAAIGDPSQGDNFY
jgi:hypothetical protein